MSLCFVPKDFVLSIGGISTAALKTVECYDIKKDSWRNISYLNEARWYASSCFLGQNVYVFCGRKNMSEFVTSIESLSIDAISAQNKIPWQKIELTYGQILPRLQPAVIAVNNTQIIIMGGEGTNCQYTSEILLFDTNVKTVTNEIENGNYKFLAFSNQCALTS